MNNREYHLFLIERPLQSFEAGRIRVHVCAVPEETHVSYKFIANEVETDEAGNEVAHTFVAHENLPHLVQALQAASNWITSERLNPHSRGRRVEQFLLDRNRPPTTGVPAPKLPPIFKVEGAQ